MSLHFATSPDLSENPLFSEVKERFANWYRPGSGLPSDLLDLALSPDGRTVAAAAVIVTELTGLPGQQMVLIDVATGALEIVSSSSRIDRQPRWSPDGKTLSFLSDRDAPYDFQLHLFDLATRSDRQVRLDGQWVEAASWSPDGRHILLSVAGRGVDLAGAQGGIPSPLASENQAPAWAPAIDTDEKADEWRSLWLYEMTTGQVRQISPPRTTIWEAAWCGNDAVMCVATDSPREEDWYHSDLRLIRIADGAMQSIYAPQDQLGWPSAAPDGSRVAIVEAVCSDRTIVAGTLLVGPAHGQLTAVDTGGVDVTYTCWQSGDALLYAGHRSFETVLGLYMPSTGTCRELWCNQELTFGSARFAEAAAGSEIGTAALMVEGHFRRPRLVKLNSDGSEESVLSLGDEGFAGRCEKLGQASAHRWTSTDGLEIHGWLIEPEGARPKPTIVDIHGGPVWMLRPRFVGRPGYANLLVERGYSLFQPNVRGSSGRGQDYARQVFGDMGGMDTQDYLTGVDSLVATGIADAKRLGVTGGSYGGFMSAWLVTQDSRFAASVPVAPVTHWVSEHLTCHIGQFCEMFLNDDMTNPQGRYFTRSPIFFADRVTTPVMQVCGELDQNTPPGQALEFHHALRMHGKESVLLTYPAEGHGVRKMPAALDFMTRMIAWFDHHLLSKKDA